MKYGATTVSTDFSMRPDDLARAMSFPKPVQKPYPPILTGGSGPHARQRGVDFDGQWMPIAARDYSEPMESAMADLRARAGTSGRDPSALRVSLFGTPADEGKLGAWRDLGVERAVFMMPSAPRDTVLPLFDTYAAVAGKAG